MKKLFVIVLVAIGLVSCMNTDEVIEVNNDNAIAFADAFIENSVRATAYDNNTLDHFNVWGTVTAGQSTAPIFAGTDVTKANGVWSYTGATQYWVKGVTYNFRALVDGTTPVVEDNMLTGVNVDITEQEDVLVAEDMNVEYKGGEKYVAFQFAHILSKVKFTFDTTIANAAYKYEISNVKIEDKAEAAYDIESKAWSGHAGDATINFAQLDDEMFLIPSAEVKTISFDVTLKLGTVVLSQETKTVKTDIELEAGHAYNFTVALGEPGEPIKFTATVEDWDQAGAEFAPDTYYYGTIALTPKGDKSQIVVKDKEGLLKLTELFANWTDLFTDGNGSSYTNYHNGAGTDFYYSGNWTINIAADIDLEGATIDPIIIKHPVSAGTPVLNGNDHWIKNATITTDPTTTNMAGLFDLSYAAVKNLKLDNINVTGSLVGNSTAGILSGSANHGVQNITITNSSVWGGKYTGGVVGYGYTSVNNCTLTNCVVKGGYKCGGVIGYICASNANGNSVNNNTLTDCTVEGTDGQYAGGKSEYILGKVVGNFNCNGSCGNNTITNMTTSATANIGQVEAGMTVTYGLTAINEAAAGATINIDTPVVIEGGNVVLDLEGKTINAAQSSAIEVKGGQLTIKNGNITAYESVVRAIGGGKVIIESGDFVSTGTAVGTPSTYRYSVDSREGGEIIINGGTFKSNNGMINVSSPVTINGGKFENVVEKTMTRHFAYVSAPLTINGGEFLGIANSGAGGCFFCGAAAGCDITIKGGQFTSLWTSGSVNRIFESYYGGTFEALGGTFNTTNGLTVAPGYKVVGGNGVYVVAAEASVKEVSNAASFKTAANASSSDSVINATGVVIEGNTSLNVNGATVIGGTFKNESGNAVSGTINGTFKGCEFTGSNGLRGCYAGETVVFEGCEFDGNTYGVHFDGGANDVIFKNCTISGFNALGAALTMATFENCTFVGNGKSGYNGANLWGSAKLINCEFTFDGSTATEWIDCIGADKTYEFVNCTINGVAYTPANYTDYDAIFSRNNVTVKINGVDCAL
ncbi:MAG: hypothetical protein J6K78_07585 [Tidjanibacter sp.]|nr:hypothetical protein [Tidjanibacter sp.]